MGLKFRRGTTAQKSGSLAFGEPYVNTDLGTLQIGGASGDITLGASGTGSAGQFSTISGSGLRISGNAQVDGNLTIGGQVTIGDNTSDSVNVVASLSSSLIPQTTNVFDLGSATKIWKDLYISTGSIKFVDPGTNTVVGTLSSNAGGDFKVAGEISGSTINGLGNATLYSSSVASRLVTVEAVSGSVKAVTDTFATSASVASATATSISTLSGSVKAVTDTFATSASLASARATDISTISGSVKTVTDALSGRVTTLEGKDISITLTGDVTGTGTITDLANVSFATTIAANSVALGTDTTGDYVATMTAGTGITVGTATGEGSTPVITNTGVTSNVAGTGISVSGGTGAVTITNSGVTSAVAGTGVSVSGATGAVTFSIGQAVATTDNLRFNSLGIGMAASATAGRIDATNDVVAFSSSDIRFKENIVPIENALDKISKISGNTYDWKAENKIEHGYEGNDVGVIAQEIEAVLPQLVQTRENGFKAVKYDKLVALLIEGIKEQQTQIEKLRMDLDNYECKCDNCKSK